MSSANRSNVAANAANANRQILISRSQAPNEFGMGIGGTAIRHTSHYQRRQAQEEEIKLEQASTSEIVLTEAQLLYLEQKKQELRDKSPVASLTPEPAVKKERKNISNLPEERLNVLRGAKKQDDDNIPGFTPDKAKAGKKRPHATFFAAWDDTEQLDIDFTTE